MQEVMIMNQNNELYAAIRLTQGTQFSLIIPCKRQLNYPSCIWVPNEFVIEQKEIVW